jgi:hypothetical protein
LQMEFKVMIVMNVPSMMHWIIGGIEMEMWWNMWVLLLMKLKKLQGDIIPSRFW